MPSASLTSSATTWPPSTPKNSILPRLLSSTSGFSVFATKTKKKSNNPTNTVCLYTIIAFGVVWRRRIFRSESQGSRSLVSEVIGLVHEEAQTALPLLVDFVDDRVSVMKNVPMPLNINSLVNKCDSFPVLRRCVFDSYTPLVPTLEPEQSLPSERGFWVPPLLPRFRRSMLDLFVPSPDKTLSCLSSKETVAPDSVEVKNYRFWVWDDD
ncbi:hypothetical protein JHK85_006509 [Glycine max]|uniref:Uncharacterized protein n=1 Tax=Glycine soja TaxID=3848 RepID=A0A445L863_GLYSO|nr:hypothetical protein JHK85_006509 [Glycine max]RZC19134.1 hypothetical protein D0Y65_006096 [Glycine soja]